MRRKIHYVIKPEHLWNNIAEMARTQNDQLLVTLEEGFGIAKKANGGTVGKLYGVVANPPFSLR